MNKLNIPQKYLSIIEKIKTTSQENNLESYIVGGFVRDLLLNRVPFDLDIMVESILPPPSSSFTSPLAGEGRVGGYSSGIVLSQLLSQKYNLSKPVIFERFGTSKLIIDNEEVEFVMPRKEYYTDDSRNPDTQIASLDQDALRRDFTVNALFLRLSDMQILDLTKRGLSDLENKIIRVTDPDSAEFIFNQDPLRIVRAVRQSLQLGFKIEEITFAAMKKAVHRIDIVSPERIRDEINKILIAKNPSMAFKMMDEIGLLEKLFPYIKRLQGLKQRKEYHDDDAYNHTLKVLDRVENSLVLRMAAFLHDIGKLATYKEEDGKITSYGHDKESAKLAQEILKNLKYSKEFNSQVVNIIANHMRPKMYDKSWSDSAIRRFVLACGTDLDMVLQLAAADYGKDKPQENLGELIGRIEDLKKKNTLYPNIEILSGKEMMDYFKRPQGEWIKKAKEKLQEAVIENPSLTKEEAFKIVKQLLP